MKLSKQLPYNPDKLAVEINIQILDIHIIRKLCTKDTESCINLLTAKERQQYFYTVVTNAAIIANGIINNLIFDNRSK